MASRAVRAAVIVSFAVVVLGVDLPNGMFDDDIAGEVATFTDAKGQTVPIPAGYERTKLQAQSHPRTWFLRLRFTHPTLSSHLVCFPTKAGWRARRIRASPVVGRT